MDASDPRRRSDRDRGPDTPPRRHRQHLARLDFCPSRASESVVEKRSRESVRPGSVAPVALWVDGRAQTPIARWADRGAIVQGSEEEYEEEFLAAHAVMVGAGFEH